MNTPNKVLRQSASESLKGKWGLVVKFTLLYYLITIVLGIIPGIGQLISIFIGGPIFIGMMMFYLSLSRHENARVEQLFDGFQNFWRSFKAYWIVVIKILLWTLLLIVPGIMKAFAYAMTFFIIIDDKDIAINDAINKSEKMMFGNRMKLFRLHLNFIGRMFLLLLIPVILWGIVAFILKGGADHSMMFVLAILIVIIILVSMIWLMTWMQVSVAKFYDDIKESIESTPEVVAIPEVVKAPETNGEHIVVETNINNKV